MNTSAFKQQLIDLKHELQHYQVISKDASQPVKLEQNKVGRLSRMDAMQDQQIAKDIKHRRDLQLQKIERSLVRIDNDEYGICLQCDEDINPLRLKFDPTTTFCIECASKNEKS